MERNREKRYEKRGREKEIVLKRDNAQTYNQRRL